MVYNNPELASNLSAKPASWKEATCHIDNQGVHISARHELRGSKPVTLTLPKVTAINWRDVTDNEVGREDTMSFVARAFSFGIVVAVVIVVSQLRNDKGVEAGMLFGAAAAAPVLALGAWILAKVNQLLGSLFSSHTVVFSEVTLRGDDGRSITVRVQKDKEDAARCALQAISLDSHLPAKAVEAEMNGNDMCSEVPQAAGLRRPGVEAETKGIVTCSTCSVKVLPMAGGFCPACRKPIA